jgi:plasmid maintenance system antidote protein VapI
VLLEEFLKPMSLSQNQLALAIRGSCTKTREINHIHGLKRITDTAIRLAYYFNMSPLESLAWFTDGL